MTTSPRQTNTGEMQRQLATVEIVLSIRDIPNADNIVCARIRGWDVVVKRNEFTVGDQCVYFEVDSLLDITDPRFEFLAERGVRTDTNGNTGHVLKTARLRGQYSQGLALPLDQFTSEPGFPANPQPGDDVTEALGIIKWDPPIPAELVGQVRGMRPSTIPGTGEVRVQNLNGIFDVTDVRWVATEKIDGESTTFYIAPDGSEDGGRLDGVCTRNLDLLPNPENTMWGLAYDLNIHDKIATQWPGQHVAVQGETFGQRISPNPLRIVDTRFAAFTLRVDGSLVPRSEWPEWLLALSVPIHDLPFPASADEALAQVETLKSLVPGVKDRAAEGIVWCGADRTSVVLPDGQVHRASMKVVSNKYLMKNDR